MTAQLYKTHEPLVCNQTAQAFFTDANEVSTLLINNRNAATTYIKIFFGSTSPTVATDDHVEIPAPAGVSTAILFSHFKDSWIACTANRGNDATTPGTSVIVTPTSRVL